MKKALAFIFFIVVCNDLYSQIIEESLNYTYTDLESQEGMMDSTLTFSNLTVDFALEDTLNFKSVQVQLNDGSGNLILNELHTKQGLITVGNYNNGQITLNLGVRVRSYNYTLFLIYHKLDSTNFPAISKPITDE